MNESNAKINKWIANVIIDVLIAMNEKAKLHCVTIALHVIWRDVTFSAHIANVCQKGDLHNEMCKKKKKKKNSSSSSSVLSTGCVFFANCSICPFVCVSAASGNRAIDLSAA